MNFIKKFFKDKQEKALARAFRKRSRQGVFVDYVNDLPPKSKILFLTEELRWLLFSTFDGDNPERIEHLEQIVSQLLMVNSSFSIEESEYLINNFKKQLKNIKLKKKLKTL